VNRNNLTILLLVTLCLLVAFSIFYDSNKSQEPVAIHHTEIPRFNENYSSIQTTTDGDLWIYNGFDHIVTYVKKPKNNDEELIIIRKELR